LKYAITWIASWISSSPSPCVRSSSIASAEFDAGACVSASAKSQSARVRGGSSALR